MGEDHEEFVITGYGEKIGWRARVGSQGYQAIVHRCRSSSSSSSKIMAGVGEQCSTARKRDPMGERRGVVVGSGDSGTRDLGKGVGGGNMTCVCGLFTFLLIFSCGAG